MINSISLNNWMRELKPNNTVGARAHADLLQQLESP